MSCPTCSHTLQRLTGEIGHGFYHCPRCGTVMEQAVDEDGRELYGFPKVYVPKLVTRCREFSPTHSAPLWTRWHLLGINEAIWPEYERRLST